MRASSCLAQETGGMRFVHHDDGVVFFSQFNYLVQLGNGTVHAERSVRHNNPAPAAGGILKFGFQISHVVVLIPETLRLAEPYAINDGSVVERIRDDRVFLVEQWLEDTPLASKAAT